jgi:hypothetical protein
MLHILSIACYPPHSPPPWCLVASLSLSLLLCHLPAGVGVAAALLGRESVVASV